MARSHLEIQLFFFLFRDGEEKNNNFLLIKTSSTFFGELVVHAKMKRKWLIFENLLSKLTFYLSRSQREDE